MLGCKICASTQRTEIESALLRLNLDNTNQDKGRALKLIADEYSLQINELKVHAVMHMPLPVDGLSATLPSAATDYEGYDEIEVNVVPATGKGIAKQMQLQESDMLIVTAQEYLTTLQSIGRRINRIASAKSSSGDLDGDYMFAKYITKPLVDLYIGAGRELRDTLKAIADVNQIINGPKETNTSGLSALAEALKISSAALGPSSATPTAVGPGASQADLIQSSVAVTETGTGCEDT